MNWIKMRKELRDEPEVFQLATELKKPRDEIIGLLHRFWCWVDGHMERDDSVIDCDAIDVIVACQGFAKSLENAGWLRVTKTGIVIPKFERHLSQGAKRRALHAEKMRAWRGRQRDDSVTQNRLPDKRREDEMRNIHHPSHPSVSSRGRHNEPDGGDGKMDF